MVKAARAKLPGYEPGEVIARFRDASGGLSVDAEPIPGQIVERFDFGHRPAEHGGDLVRIKLPPGVSVGEGIRELAKSGQFEYAEPNYRYYLDEPVASDPVSTSETKEQSFPNDLTDSLWGLHNHGQPIPGSGWGLPEKGKPGADISAKEAWKITTGDRRNGPIVAIIDSGVDVSHPDLVDNLWTNPGEVPGDGIDNDGNGVVDDVHGYNAYDDNNILTDSKTHGTHVAGTVGATGNNGIGITGVAPRARLMPIKIFGEVGHTNQATVLRGLAYADRMGARITANSWGGIQSRAMEDAYASSPALHIASAGNSKRNTELEPHFPGSYPLENMIAVAATDHHDKLGSFSNYGKTTVHLGAPGVKIHSTLPRNRYKSFDGTSMACPHVAGAASLILTEYPEASNQEVRDRLLYGTDPLADLAEKTYSGGRLNAARALEADEVVPAAPRGFSAQHTERGVLLQWQPLHDDGEQGEASAALLSRTGPDGTTVVFPPLRGELSFRDSAALSGGEYSYILRAVDNVGNRSDCAETKIVLEERP